MVKTVGLLTRDRIAPAETVTERLFRSVPDSLKGLFPE